MENINGLESLSVVKKTKLEVDGNEDFNKKEKPIIMIMVDNFRSPITDPVLIPEVWEKIFRELSGDDFVSVINSTPEWNRLLDSRKTSELFPKLVTHVLPYLDSTTDILACRKVQRGSKIAVDKYLESSWTSSKRVCDFRRKKLFYEVEKINHNYLLNSKSEIDKFSNALSLWDQDNSYNPFLTRALSMDLNVSIDVEEEEQQQQQQQRLALDHVRMTELLSRFGTHVWRLSIKHHQFDTWLDRIITYLHLVPNLKILEFSGHTVFDMRLCAGAELNLPHLENLCHLELTDCRSHTFTFRLIQRYGPQLSTLVVPGICIQLLSRIINETVSFRNLLAKLKRLCVMYADVATLENLLKVELPLLENLHLWLEPSVTTLNDNNDNNNNNNNKKELLLLKSVASNFKLLTQLQIYFDEGITTKEHGLIKKKSHFIANEILKESLMLQKVVMRWKLEGPKFVNVIITRKT